MPTVGQMKRNHQVKNRIDVESGSRAHMVQIDYMQASPQAPTEKTLFMEILRDLNCAMGSTEKTMCCNYTRMCIGELFDSSCQRSKSV